MNILIVGGLFAVAILAIIGIVLLSLSERGAEAARKASAQSASLAAPTLAKSARPTVPLTPQEHSEPVTRPAAKEAVIQRRTFPRKGEAASTDHEENSLLPMLNGQFHEFVDELRDLHQQAWELEHRLSTLTQMVDRIERTQTNRISIEEDEEETFNVEDAQK
ncbi:MAG TPA: hypothetical protein VNG51_26460 [Ktedonobacteraceae bacterium]|nr:hypothetical protein [Ktedonobacteraceae bacterium]